MTPGNGVDLEPEEQAAWSTPVRLKEGRIKAKEREEEEAVVVEATCAVSLSGQFHLSSLHYIRSAVVDSTSQVNM